MCISTANHIFYNINSLDQDVGLRLLACLNADSLAVMCVVSKHWHLLTNKKELRNQLNLRTLYKRVTYIDCSTWRTHVNTSQYGLSFEGHVDDQNEIILKLRKCLFWPIEKIGESKPGLTVLTIPKGLSINKIRQFAPDLFRLLLQICFLEGELDVEVSQTYTIIISNNIIEGTRTKTVSEQIDVIKNYGGVMPKVIEVITLLVLTYLVFKKKLYETQKNHPTTFTLCEHIKHIRIGEFKTEGFRVDYFCLKEYVGLAAVVKFPT